MELYDLKNKISGFINLEKEKKELLISYVNKVDSIKYSRDEFRFRRGIKKHYKREYISVYDKDDFDYLEGKVGI